MGDLLFNNMKAFIKAVSYYLPERVLTNAQLTERFPEWSVEKVASKIGINQRHIAGEKEFVSDMAISASKILFKEHHIEPTEIDFILLCTQSPDYFLPTTACIVQDKLGIPKNAGALDFNLGCSGYVYGLAIAKGLIMANIAKNILLITSEAYSKHINNKDKGNSTIFGDAASATLLSTTGFAELKEFELGTDGSGANNLIVKEGGMRYPEKLNQEINEGENGIIWPSNLYMNGSEIFNFTLESIPTLVKSTIQKNNIEEENVDMYILHQANKYLLNHLRKKIGIPEDKFFIFMENCGNTVSSTIPIALHEAMKSNKIHSNQKILLAGFGVGYSWGACIIETN
jgi:3-oxoacyl-[acyl-carrier-protein] synthase-3